MKWIAKIIDFTCLYPWPTKRARKVVVFDIEVLKSFMIASSEIDWALPIGTVDSTFTVELRKSWAPWIYLQFKILDLCTAFKQ